jgi:DNA-binding MarR family transcriptional regulator
VERHSSNQDGRANQLRITSAGETLLRRAYDLVQAADAACFGAIQAETTIFNQHMQQLTT